MSTAYHPETDGQSERVNGVINQYLRVYCTYLQDDWVDLLATAEFSYNNSWQASIKTTPFIANFGRNPSFDSGEAKSFTDVPSELADRLYEVREFISKNLEKAREDQKRFADRHREEAPTYMLQFKILADYYYFWLQLESWFLIIFNDFCRELLNLIEKSIKQMKSVIKTKFIDI